MLDVLNAEQELFTDRVSWCRRSMTMRVARIHAAAGSAGSPRSTQLPVQLYDADTHYRVRNKWIGFGSHD